MEINENISNIVRKLAVDASKRNEKISTITIANMFLNNMFSSQVDGKSFAKEVLKYNILLVQILDKVTTGEITVNELQNHSNTTSNNPIDHLEVLFPGITNLIIDKNNGISFKREFEETFTPFLDNPTTSTEEIIVNLLNKNKNYFQYLTNIYLDHNFGPNRKSVNKKLLQKYSHIPKNNNQHLNKSVPNIKPNEIIPYIIQSEINKKTPKIESMVFQLCSTFMRVNFIKQDPNYSGFAQDLKTNDFLSEILTSVNEMIETKTLTSNNISYYYCKQVILNSSINGTFKPELATDYIKSNISMLVPIIHDYLGKKYSYEQSTPSKRQEDPSLRLIKRNRFFSDELKQKIKEQIQNNPFTTQQEIINAYINNEFDYNILNVKKEEFLSTIIKDYIVNSIETKDDDVFLNIKAITPLIDENTNCLTYIENNPALLNLLITEYYNNNFGFKIKQDIKLTNHEKNIVNMLLSKVDYDKDERKKFSNTKINHQLINKCREDIINGSQFNHKRRSYSYDNMYATTDIGKFRSNQEDSVIITSHPKLPECKLIIVADGVGGYKNGELASLQVTRNMLKWFERLTPSDLKDTPENLQEKYITAIQKTNTIICQDPSIKNGGSTFAGALVTNQNTIIANVGDSRGYIYINGELEQITTDHSHTQLLYEKNIIKNRDDMRFHKESNVITQMLGESPIRISSKIIPNNYDKLILLSDGVTDCLSDEQIKIITKSKAPEVLADAIVDTALNTDSIKPVYLENRNYLTEIKGGKDNTTAAILDNINKRR